MVWGWAPDSARAGTCLPWAGAARCVCVVCGAWCDCVRTGMAWSSVFMRWSFATAVSFVASGGCSLRNACMVGAWCVSLRDLAVLGV